MPGGVEMSLHPNSSSPGLSHSVLVRRKIRLACPDRDESDRSLLTHPRVAEFYPEVLFLLHSTARASVPLMQAALARSRELAPHDAVAAGLLDYLAEHILEEANHDEWMLEDMELLGMPREAVLRRIPSPDIISAVGAQYYWIHHVHPVALLGYLEALEGEPVPLPAVQYAMQHSGLPAAAFRTVLIHAENDPHHSADLDRLIDALPLGGEHSAMVGISAISITGAVHQAYAAILQPYLGTMKEG